MPPQPQTPRNHNDVTLAMQSIKETGAQLGVLTHVGHALDVWLLEHRRRLPRHVTVGRDARII
nr:hypothetical protein [Pseudomonas synxantha]